MSGRVAAQADSGTRATPRPAATRFTSEADSTTCCTGRGAKPASRQASHRSVAKRESRKETKGSSRRSASAIAARAARRCPAGRATPTASGQARTTFRDGSSGGRRRKPRSMRCAWSAAGCSPGGISCRRTSTPGYRSPKSRISRPSGPARIEPVSPISRVPVRPAPTARASAQASSTSPRMPRARARKAVPAGVRATLRLVRHRSGVPSSASRSRICWLSGGCDTPSRSAAAVKLRDSATATK